MKKILIVLFLLPLLAMAQNNKSVAQVKTHTVGVKESLSSIGRLYEVNGRVLAVYNNIDYEKGLVIGQVLKIPPKGTTMENLGVKTEEKKAQPPVVKTEPKNEQKTEPKIEQKTEPVQRAVTKTEAGGTPIYHKVGKKETLYHISTLYGKVPIDNLKKWNNLTSDAVTEGTNLIVGYSKTKAVVQTTPVVKVEKEKPVVIQSEKKEPSKPVKETETIDPKMTAAPVKDFKILFESQNSKAELINQEGTAGSFKSTSGWKDGKYYCLHNTATPGTIIKVTNPANGKFVFAKVLDGIPDIKQNNGLVICISNAAVAELGAPESSFNCLLNYSK